MFIIFIQMLKSCTMRVHTHLYARIGDEWITFAKLW